MLTQCLLSKMFEMPAAQDLANVCIKWSKKNKKKLSGFEIVNDLGEITSLTPIKKNVLGSW